MTRILCLWLPDWSAQRVLDGAREPLALHVRDARRGECIAVANQAARKAGIREGMPLSEAQALLQHSQARSHLVRYDAAADREALQQLAVHCDRFSPCVGLGEAYPRPSYDTADAYDSLLLDVTSIGALFGGEHNLAETIRADLAAKGYVAHIAIADRVATAWALAHFVDAAITIHAEGWPALQPLPIAALRVSPLHVEVLRELGIEWIEQLADLPMEALAERFDASLIHQLDRANGTRAELIVPLRAAPEFHAEWLLEYPTTDRRALEQILDQLTQRVGYALRMRDRGALQLACRLDIAESVPRLVELGLFRPSADPRHFMELLRLQGETLRLRGAVGRVGLMVQTSAPLEHRQRELFAGSFERQSDELAALINRLSNRLGRSRVTRPKLTRDTLPERAYTLEPLTNHDGTSALSAHGRTGLAKKASRRLTLPSSQEPRAPVIVPQANARPISLLPEPVPLAVVAIAPDGPPAIFQYHGQTHRVARHWGPERIETAWWRGPSVRRDYYRVEVSDGRRFWLFRELRSGQWFLHGHFD